MATLTCSLFVLYCAVVLRIIGNYWELLGSIGKYWEVLGSIGKCEVFSKFPKPSQIFSKFPITPWDIIFLLQSNIKGQSDEQSR